jgi:hemerythrin
MDALGGICMAFTWTENLAVGFSEIDTQHKELFKSVNDLLEATSHGKGRDEVGKIIQFLESYVVKHFAMEEKYMAKYNYPGLTTHQTQHVLFVNEFGQLKRQFEAEGATSHITLLIQSKVCDWLINHIGKTDKQLGPFLQSK